MAKRKKKESNSWVCTALWIGVGVGFGLVTGGVGIAAMGTAIGVPGAVAGGIAGTGIGLANKAVIDALEDDED